MQREGSSEMILMRPFWLPVAGVPVVRGSGTDEGGLHWICRVPWSPGSNCSPQGPGSGPELQLQEAGQAPFCFCHWLVCRTVPFSLPADWLSTEQTHYCHTCWVATGPHSHLMSRESQPYHKPNFPGLRMVGKDLLAQNWSGSRTVPSALVRGQGAWTNVAAGVDCGGQN